jgi:hypothetical protein
MTAMTWVSVEEALPRHGQAVLVRRAHDNWLTEHTLADGGTRNIWRWQAARFIRGRTLEEAKKVNIFRSEDQFANNLVPYCWEQFGPGTLFGQDVTHWAAITDPTHE